MRQLRACFLALLSVVGLVAADGPAEEPSPLTLCLAAAADDSPVYPLKAVPATNREMLVVFRLRPGESFEKLTNVWFAVDVGEFAPPNAEIGRGDLALRGHTHGHFRYSLPKDFPVGTYRLDVAADGEPWASLDFSVAPPAEATDLAKPEDLLPLEPGTSWTYSWMLEPGPGVKKLTVAGADKGEDGKFRTTTTVSVAAKEDAGTRMEWRRKDAPTTEEWWSLTAEGLVLTQVRSGDQPLAFDPPRPMIALPLRSPHRWTHQPKDGSPSTECRMWGPLPVRTATDERPGWIVWLRTASGQQISTIERHFAPGVGVVREVHVDAVGPALLTRIETALLPPD